jgi:hypothetical protein
MLSTTSKVQSYRKTLNCAVLKAVCNNVRVLCSVIQHTKANQDSEITCHWRRAQEANLKSNNNIKFLLLMHHLLCKQQLSSLQGFRHLHNMQLHPNSINFSDVHPSLNTQEDKKGCMKALGGEKQRVKHTSCGTQILD